MTRPLAVGRGAILASHDLILATNYDVLFFADLDEGSIGARVTGDMDPGYGSTSKMIAESALCLIQDCSDLAGGIYTPAPSMGEKLIDRLIKKAGLTFDIV